MRMRGAAIATCLAGAFGHPPATAAATGAIEPRAVETGIAAALVSVEGSVRASVAIRAGTFVALGPGRLGFELEPTYTHVGELDGLEVGGALSWQPATGTRADALFVAAACAWREEWLGSFRQARVPVGVNAGFRVLLDRRAGVRGEYRYRRVLRDPVAAFSEHQLVMGLSLFFRNGRAPSAP